MSNKESYEVMTIGMKHSDKEFVIYEKSMEEDEYEELINNIKGMFRKDIEGFTVLNKNQDFLYLSCDSIAYITKKNTEE